MIGRRTFLGAAAAGVGLATVPASARVLRRSRVAVVSDPRFAASRRFAEAAGGAGFLIHGDPVRVLRAAADTGPRLIGLTSWSDYLLAADVAREAGLVPSHRLLHDAQGHRGFGADGCEAAGCAVSGDWAAEAGRLLAGGLDTPARLLGPRGGWDGGATLVSWAFAPGGRAA